MPLPRKFIHVTPRPSVLLLLPSSMCKIPKKRFFPSLNPPGMSFNIYMNIESLLAPSSSGEVRVGSVHVGGTRQLAREARFEQHNNIINIIIIFHRTAWTVPATDYSSYSVGSGPAGTVPNRQVYRRTGPNLSDVACAPTPIPHQHVPWPGVVSLVSILFIKSMFSSVVVPAKHEPGATPVGCQVLSGTDHETSGMDLAGYRSLFFLELYPVSIHQPGCFVDLEVFFFFFFRRPDIHIAYFSAQKKPFKLQRHRVSWFSTSVDGWCAEINLILKNAARSSKTKR